MASLFLGLDLGTSGTKTLLVDRAGRVRATATVAHPSLFPKPGWSEQRPADWWASACAAVAAVLRRARARGRDVAAVGLSGQMHGSVFLDRRQRVVANAILWNDQRTTAECAEVERRAGGRPELIRLVNNVALTGFTAPKILWLRNKRPRAFQRVRTVLLPKDYLAFQLTGALVSEVSDASGTLVFDVARRTWSTPLLERLELDADLFPRVVESPTIVGAITSTAARQTGLAVGTPVAAGAGDQAAAAVGTGVVRPGVVSATIGTSGVVFAHSARPVPNELGLLQSFCHAVPGAWCVFGCMLSAGGSLQWAREVLWADELSRARSAAARDRLYTRMLAVAAAAPLDPALLFHPYLTGERCPYPHAHARGAFIGLRRQHTRGALLRAVIEGITLGMARQLELLENLGVPIREVRLAGGGARNHWWRQLQADVYGRPCAVLQSEEGSALGAALLAAAATGAFRSVAAASEAAAQVKHVYPPVAARTRHYRKLHGTSRAAYDVLEPSYRHEAP